MLTGFIEYTTAIVQKRSWIWGAQVEAQVDFSWIEL